MSRRRSSWSGPRRPHDPLPETALRRPGTARGHRPGYRHRPDFPAVRRAHRRPRPEKRRRDHGPHRGLVNEYGKTVLMVTHDPRVRRDGPDSCSTWTRGSSSRPPAKEAEHEVLPVDLGQPRRKKVRTTLTIGSFMVALFLFGLLAAVRMALPGRGRRRGRRPADRHQQGLPDPCRCRFPTATGSCKCRGVGGDLRDLVRRRLPGRAELLPPDRGRQGHLVRRVSGIHLRQERARGLACATARPAWSAAAWPSASGSKSATASLSSGRSGRGTWDFNVSGIYEGKRAEADTSGHVFPVRLSRRAPAVREGHGRLVCREARRPGRRGQSRQGASTPASPTPRTRRSPRRNKPSPPRSSSRWGTSSSWC